MAERNYRIRIAQGDREIEVEGDKTFVLQMLKKFDITQDISALPKGDASSFIDEKKLISAKPLSLGEFLRKLGVKKHTDIVLAFGYYLEKYSGIKEFTPAEINNCYYEAKMEASNTSQMIIRNLRRGFIMESKMAKKEGKKRYTVTQSGEDHINKTLQQKPNK